MKKFLATILTVGLICGGLGSVHAQTGHNRRMSKAGARHGHAVRSLGTVGNFNNMVKSTKQGKPVIAKFFATWCSTCTKMAPLFKKAKDRHVRDAQFIKIDIDRFKGLARRYKVAGVPTIIVFKDGDESDRAVGGMSADELESWVASRIK